ncbi:conserved hypothetical protein [Ricinus communis]|uniref:Uncharacterized protein n=1 Tax=Ricinus communis TaxID=3988 RepID=B9SGE1_RICCO|nr:conserved hypothetical protein [Ricinus communis]
MEDVAEMIIRELISREMLQVDQRYEALEVPGPYKKLCLLEVDEQNFIAKAANLPVRAFIKDDGKNNPLDFQSLQIVLDIQGAIESLPDEAGNMVHLRHLRLFNSNLNKLSWTLGNLHKLQTLDASL